jgi:hypothetical protein
MADLDRHLKCERIKSWFCANALHLTEVLLLLATIIVASCALFEYKQQNKLAAGKSLAEIEIEIAKHFFVTDCLNAMEVEPSGISDAKQIADVKLTTMLQCDEKGLQNIQWTDVPDLEHQILSSEKSYGKIKPSILRKGYLAADSYLAIVNEAFYAMKAKLLDPADYETYAAYIDRYGSHPLFLAAVHHWHKYKFLDPAYAGFVRQRLLNNPKHKATIHAIYPALENTEWLLQLKPDSKR